MNIYVYHNRTLLYNGPAPRGVGMLEFVPGCVADTCGDIDLTRYEVKRIGFTLNGAPVIYVQERAVDSRWNCAHCDGTGIEPFETSCYPPEPCSECKGDQ